MSDSIACRVCQEAQYSLAMEVKQGETLFARSGSFDFIVDEKGHSRPTPTLVLNEGLLQMLIRGRGLRRLYRINGPTLIQGLKGPCGGKVFQVKTLDRTWINKAHWVACLTSDKMLHFRNRWRFDVPSFATGKHRWAQVGSPGKSQAVVFWGKGDILEVKLLSSEQAITFYEPNGWLAATGQPSFSASPSRLREGRMFGRNPFNLHICGPATLYVHTDARVLGREAQEQGLVGGLWEIASNIGGVMC